jgi:hypothetical protein
MIFFLVQEVKNAQIRSVAVVFLLFANCPAFALPSFEGDWESGTVTGSGNTNWLALNAVATDRFTLLNDGIRPGTYARVEVRSGDNPLACSYNSDRAEVYGMQNANSTPIFENLTSGTQRYSFSVKFDAGWQTITDQGNGAWGIFLQLHGPNALPPALAFSATDQIRFNMFVGDVSKSKVVANDLPIGTLNTGHWIDFVLTTKFASDNTGFVNIMRRDEGETSFQEVLNLTNTPTLQFDPSENNGTVGDHYWMTGLYRSRQEFTNILYLDGMNREVVVAVPEPEVYTLMLAGLGLMGGIASRRK